MTNPKNTLKTFQVSPEKSAELIGKLKLIQTGMFDNCIKKYNVIMRNKLANSRNKKLRFIFWPKGYRY